MESNCYLDISTNYESFLKYRKTLESKIIKKPLPVQIIMRRTLNTAISVMEHLHTIDFCDLILSLYKICGNVEQGAIIHEFEKQIELAGANPDKFVLQLHQFYSVLSKKIKHMRMYQDLFRLIAYFFTMIKDNLGSDDEEQVDLGVLYSFSDLVIQTLEYLKPDQFNSNQIVAGVRTDGSIMTIKDPLPMCDAITYVCELALLKGQDYTGTKVFADIMDHYGYSAIRNFNAVQRILTMSSVYMDNICLMLPFMNEYTFEMLPSVAMHVEDYEPLPTSTILNSDLECKLKKRKRLLPTNGVIIQFDGLHFINSIRMREVMYDDAIHMLFKADLNSVGEVSGYYNTRTGNFSSVFDLMIACKSGDIVDISGQLENFILWMYCAAVRDDSDINLQSFSDSMGVSHEARVSIFTIGGSLRDTYSAADSIATDGIAEGNCTKRASRKGNPDRYEAVTRTLNGMIRRLPIGWKASERARQLAYYYGLELKDNETYVQPFIRTVYQRRDRSRVLG